MIDSKGPTQISAKKLLHLGPQMPKKELSCAYGASFSLPAKSWCKQTPCLTGS
jgi:hypothetical protein